MKNVCSALTRSSLGATKSHRSVTVLAGLALGAVLAVGTAVPASAASITGCAATPTSATVTAENPQATSAFVWQPTATANLYAFVETFLDGNLNISGMGPVGGDGVFPMGDPWSEELAGSTWVFNVYAHDGSNQKTGSVLCTFTTIYAPVGGSGDFGEFDLDIDREHYLGRPSSVGELPDTL